MFRCSFSFQISTIHGKAVRQLWEYKLCTSYIFSRKIGRNGEWFGLKDLKWQTESSGIISRTFVHGEEKRGGKRKRQRASISREANLSRRAATWTRVAGTRRAAGT